MIFVVKIVSKEIMINEYFLFLGKIEMLNMRHCSVLLNI